MSAAIEIDYSAIIGKLTKRQHEVLGLIAINQDEGHHPATIKSLLAKGLVIERDEVLHGTEQCRWPVTVKRYEVPMPIHVTWCLWCEQQPSDGEE